MPRPTRKTEQTERFSAVQKRGVRVSMRDALLECFVGMGGSEALVRWANENPTEAYKLIAKHTIPTRMEAGDGEAIRTEMTNAAAAARRKLDSAIERGGGESPPRITH